MRSGKKDTAQSPAPNEQEKPSPPESNEMISYPPLRFEAAYPVSTRYIPGYKPDYAPLFLVLAVALPIAGVEIAGAGMGFAATQGLARAAAFAKSAGEAVFWRKTVCISRGRTSADHQRL